MHKLLQEYKLKLHLLTQNDKYCSHLQPRLVSLDFHHISGRCIEWPSVSSTNHLEQQWVKNQFIKFYQNWEHFDRIRQIIAKKIKVTENNRGICAALAHKAHCFLSRRFLLHSHGHKGCNEVRKRAKQASGLHASPKSILFPRSVSTYKWKGRLALQDIEDGWFQTVQNGGKQRKTGQKNRHQTRQVMQRNPNNITLRSSDKENR